MIPDKNKPHIAICADSPSESEPSPFITYGSSKSGFSEEKCAPTPVVYKHVIRTFQTGATRDGDDGKFDYEGFLSPAVLFRFAAYMHKHRRQSDGSLRASDNWKKGIPQNQYMKSMWRHFFDVWNLHCGEFKGPLIEECLCALMFNVMGMLFEVLKERTPEAKQR